MLRKILIVALVASGCAWGGSGSAEVTTVGEQPAWQERDGCEAGKAQSLFTGPITNGFYEADVGTGRRACPRTEVGVGGRAQLIVDVPNFYGNIVGAGLVYGSVA